MPYKRGTDNRGRTVNSLQLPGPQSCPIYVGFKPTLMWA